MMCQSIGCAPTRTIGLGTVTVSSASLVPKPPARMTTFTSLPLIHRKSSDPRLNLRLLQPLAVERDLPARHSAHVLPAPECVVPVGSPPHSIVERKKGPPAE